jgi:peptidoglycan/LPS O-acetylase OafA/YrhL
VNQPPTTDTQPYLIAIIGGISLWLLTSLISGRAEAWDAPIYWTVTYPLAILLAGVLGYRAPRRAWRWGLAVMLVQAPVLLLTSGGSMGLLPLGLALFAILALPAVAAATFGAKIRGRRSGGSG